MNNFHILFDYLEQNYTIITPNNRLSQQIINNFAIKKFKEQSTNNISKPQCYPYQLFLQKIFSAVKNLAPTENHPLLLSKLQEKYLLKTILKVSLQSSFLTEIHEALVRCYNWQVDLDNEHFNYNSQTVLLQEIHHKFIEKLTKINAITNEQIINYITPFLKQYGIDKQFKKTLWVCFDDYTPQQISLHNTLHSLNSQVAHYDVKENPENITQKYIANDNIAEINQIISWIKTTPKTSETKIAVVVPNLDSEANNYQRCLQHVFDRSSFNISLGKKLITYPLIAHALIFIKLEDTLLSHDDIRIILHSPYLGDSQEEFWQRSVLIEQNELLQENFVPFKNLLLCTQEKTPKLNTLLTNLNTYPENANIYTWVEMFKKRLKILMFPGDIALNSLGYQCFLRLMNLLDEFISLGCVYNEISKQDALNILTELANATIFQPKSGKVTIEILGLLEASGLIFDKVWITGLTNLCLPKKTRLSPFIPEYLQKKYKMPHALDERELQFAQQILHRLRNSSQNTILSYPALTGDLVNMPSPLIADFPLYTPYIAEDAKTIEEFLHTEEYFEDYTIEILAHEKISGGSELIANQAKCPFRGFAIHRLKAKIPYTIKDAISTKERGILIHKIMELFWQDVKDQKTLLQLSQEQINSKIDFSVQTAINSFIRNERFVFPKLIQEIEIERLTELVKQLIVWEKERPDFIVQDIEKEFNLEISNISLKIRVDRIDKVRIAKDYNSSNQDTHDECLVVTDYKTSKNSLPTKTVWTTQRPENPQLLIYAMLNTQIRALLFLVLNAGQLEAQGLTEQPGIINNPNTNTKNINTIKAEESWDDYQQKWDKVLTDLANEFSSGYALPQPAKKTNCTTCPVKSICRATLDCTDNIPD